jgi:hypothetical protein
MLLSEYQLPIKQNEELFRLKLNSILANVWERGGNYTTPEVFDPTAGTGGDDTVALQAAIDTGLAVFLSDKTYLAHGLTQSAVEQVIWGRGTAITKNANGALFTSTARDIELNGITFRGESATYTGHNIVLSGNNPKLINCSSYDAADRALLATGAHVQVMASGGVGGVYQTADATSTGYDVEIGVSGTATLYHLLFGIRTSQPTGGVLMIATGAARMIGCQIGKFTCQSGGAPAGSGGPAITSCRIIGVTSLDQSGGVISDSQLAGNMTLEAVSNNWRIDESNVRSSGTTVTNLGNGNNVIIRQVSAASYPTFRYGADATPVDIDISPNFYRSSVSFRLLNNVAMVWEQITTPGTSGATMGLTVADNLSITNSVSGKAIQISQAGAGVIQFITNGTERVRVNDAGLLMATAQKWIVVTGTPEGVVTAPIGSLATRTDGGPATTLYIKESGSGNTGWVAK